MPSPHRCLFGLETEYAVMATDASGQPMATSIVAGRLFARALTRPHVPCHEGGVFLPNGGRFYVDVGGHPEYAAPETTNPWDAVRYALAGDRLMAALAREVVQQHPDMPDLVVRKGNVCYSGQTWGSHENYFYNRVPPSMLRPALVSHLVSRIVLTGGGGFDPFDKARARFVLSPRAFFVRSVDGRSAPGAIAIVDDRSQPHCATGHRQHVMVGDANQSHLSSFLRIGTTALVIALIDRGIVSVRDMKLADPLVALATVTRDVTLRAPLALSSGGETTAIAIQRHYLERARAHADQLPVWAAAVCDIWDDTLARLEKGPYAVADRLDWAIKWAVFRDRAARRGVKWPANTSAVPRSGRAAKAADTWRAELLEIDLRLGQVCPSLFAQLDESNVLRHRVAGIDTIDEALSTPPSDGRAHVRGTVVARLAAASASEARGGWDFVIDPAARRSLNLSDPFVREEVWLDMPTDRPAIDVQIERLAGLVRSSASPRATRAIRALAIALGRPDDDAAPIRQGRHAIDVNNLAFELRNVRRYEEAEWLMRAALAIDIAVRPPDHPKLPHRRNNLATVLLMLGRLADAREESARAWSATHGRRDLTSARILAIRLFIAFCGGESPDPFIGRLKTHLEIDPLPDFSDVERRWQVSYVIDALAPRIDAGSLDLLRAIGAVLNGDRARTSLGAHPCWDRVPALPLDEPWPGWRETAVMPSA